MKIFWGKPHPLHALFSTQPFFSHAKQLVTTLPSPQSIRIRNRRFLPDKKQWTAMVEKALGEIKKGHLEKVVLARCVIYECAESPDPFALTAALQPLSTGATLFCLSEESKAFLGATPELLFSRSGNQIKSVAMAGTRKRGKTPQADQRLEQELLSSSKDLREWSFIPRHLQTFLSPLCKTPLTFSPLRIHKTQNVQHLYSHCKGTLKHPDDAAILNSLHPTPAVCGTPLETAASLIRELEPFDRGLYSGVIGWQTPELSEWFVAIRSCFLQGNTICVYTGTGIVEGSNPDSEWEELNQKLKLYEQLFC